MATFNSVTLMGYLTRTPDITTKNKDGKVTTIANTGIAVNRKYKDKEEVMFINLVAFGRTAEIMGEYLLKGANVLISGRLVMQTWEDDHGQKRTSHNVVIEEMQMLDKKKE